MQCRICNVEKDEKEFRTYTDKRTNATYKRSECNLCLAKLQKERSKKEEFKICKTCEVSKPITEFYKTKKNHTFGRCKACQREIDRNEEITKRNSRGGSERVNPKPGVFVDEAQKEQTHMVLRMCGFKYSETTGHWYKLPYKTKNNEWPLFNKRKEKENYYILPHMSRTSSAAEILIKNKEDIFKMRQDGEFYYKIAEKYNVSQTTIRKFCNKYMYEKTI